MDTSICIYCLVAQFWLSQKSSFSNFIWPAIVLGSLCFWPFSQFSGLSRAFRNFFITCPSLMDGQAGRGHLLLPSFGIWDAYLVFGMVYLGGGMNWVFGLVLLVFWDVGVWAGGGCWWGLGGTSSYSTSSSSSSSSSSYSTGSSNHHRRPPSPKLTPASQPPTFEPNLEEKFWWNAAILCKETASNKEGGILWRNGRYWDVSPVGESGVARAAVLTRPVPASLFPSVPPPSATATTAPVLRRRPSRQHFRSGSDKNSLFLPKFLLFLFWPPAFWVFQLLGCKRFALEKNTFQFLWSFWKSSWIWLVGCENECDF